MSKKKTQPRKARPARTSTTTVPIDHRALALLAYIDGGNDGSTAIVQARTILRHVADAIVSAKLDDDIDPDVMHGTPKGPGVYATVFDTTRRGFQQRPDFQPHAQFMTEIEGDRVDELTVTNPEVAFDVMVACVTDAAVLGAAIMYELMNAREVAR